jgi:hypothetical protein
MFGSFHGKKEEIVKLFNDYLKELKKGDSLDRVLTLLKDKVSAKFDSEDDFVKDLESYIKLSEVTNKDRLAELEKKELTSLFGKAGLSINEINRLFRVTGIFMTTDGDVFCTFWRTSGFMLRDVWLNTLSLPSGVTDKPKKRLEIIADVLELEDLNELLSQNGLHLKEGANPQVEDRKIIIDLDNVDRLILKFSRAKEDHINLAVEAARLEYLHRNKTSFKIEGDVTEALNVQGKQLFHFKAPPFGRTSGISDQAVAIAYILPQKSRRVYLNDPRIQPNIMSKAAMIGIKDLARLAKAGIIHTALIPLYHNREDERPYEWYWRYNTRGGEYILGGGAGRLDRWLYNCRFPNLMLYGLNDFEHMEYKPDISAENMRNETGNHLLSWTLVVGSYFKERKNFAGDEVRFKELLRAGFNGYYEEITGRKSHLDSFINWDELCEELIDEMRSDKWKHDTINPDLGPFNGPFSAQKLIRAIYITSTFAVLDIGHGVIREPASKKDSSGMEQIFIHSRPQNHGL